MTDLVNRTACWYAGDAAAGSCLRVRDDGLAVVAHAHAAASLACWYPVAADWLGAVREIHAVGGYPAEVRLLIDGILSHGQPADALVDWLVESGPAHMAAAVAVLCSRLRPTA